MPFGRARSRHGRLGLLFTDADTVHLPGSLARSLAEAQQHGCGSAFVFSRAGSARVLGKGSDAGDLCRTGATYRPSQVNDPASPIAAAANGQYLLISREAYDAVGGHAAVGTSLLEDVALARAVKASGAQDLVSLTAPMSCATRMYRSFGPVAGRLDQESGVAVSLAVASGGTCGSPNLY